MVKAKNKEQKRVQRETSLKRNESYDTYQSTPLSNFLSKVSLTKLTLLH
jgi:hypothetical protein